MDLEFKGSIGNIYKMEASQFGVPFIICDGNDTIAHIYPTKNDIENENRIECEANANLYVSAPDLLEALKDLVRYCEENNVGAELELSHSAIEKALK
jgi:hypothetical protein